MLKENYIMLFGLFNRQQFNEWHSYIPLPQLDITVQVLYEAIAQYHRESKGDEIDITSFIPFFSSRYKEKWDDNAIYSVILSKIQDSVNEGYTPTSIDAVPVIRSLSNKAAATKVADKCREVISGGSPDEEKSLMDIKITVTEQLDRMYRKKALENSIMSLDTDDSHVSYDNAFPWCISFLNKAVGWYSNHLIVAGAVPDGGKTAFAISQAVYQARYIESNGDTDGVILVVSNDQGITPILRRVKSCVLQQDYAVWSANRDQANDDISKILGSSSRIQVVDAGGFSTDDIDQLIESYEGRIRGLYIDQLYKVQYAKTRKSGNEVERLSGLFNWAKDTALSTCALFTVHQLGAGLPLGTFLGMDSFYGVKTMLQGPADVIITINRGKEGEGEAIRYCAIPKNKVYGHGHIPEVAENDRHFHMRIKPSTSTFTGLIR